MRVMPAHYIGATWTNPLQGVIQFVTTVIGPDLSDDSTDAAPRSANFGWIAVLSLTLATALLLIVVGHGAGRRGDALAPFLFWPGVGFLIVPISLRIAWPLVARGERLFLLFLLAEALFYYKVIYSPTGFAHHDEFLHWIAADDLMTARRLFLSNPLLPIGRSYPGLEIVATAIVNITGLPLFAAAILLLAVLKGMLVTALFLLYEKITGSPRISAIACLVYMGCTTFVVFDAMFSYESIGIALCVLIFAVEAAFKDLAGREWLKGLGFIALLLMSLSVSHHLAAAYAAIYLGSVAVLEGLRRDASLRIEARIAVALAGMLAIVLPLLWMEVWGNYLTGYIGPVVESGFKTLVGKIMGAPRPDQLGAPPQPLALRLTTLLAVLLLALGLATGFFRSLAMAAQNGTGRGWRPIQYILRRRWRDSRVVFLTFLAFGFPISVAFRLTVGGWEIGNRIGTFVFIAVGLVVGVSVVHFWQGRAPSGWRRIVPALALAIVVLGGVTASSLNPIRGHYRVVADAQSIEPMGIETALWTKAWLGAGNRFTSDRINRLLLASFGRQDVRTEIVEGVTTSRVFANETLGPDEFWSLARSDIDFLLVDLRLSTARPVLGFYFEQWEAYQGRLSGSDLLKFNDVKGIARIYDNGWIVIYDVRRLHGIAEQP